MSKNIRLLKKALFDKLNNDTTLRNLLGGPGRIVHKEPNKTTQYPCLAYAIITDADYAFNEDQEGSDTGRAFIRINIFIKESKTERLDNIAARVRDLLNGQRTLDTDEIICYSCYRDNLMEPMKDPNILAWTIASRYRVSWAVK